MPTKMESLPHWGHVDLSDVYLPAAEEFGKMMEQQVLKAAGEMINYVIKNEKPHPWFPCLWSDGIGACDGLGGPPVDDPAVLYVEIPFSDDDSTPTWKILLDEAVEDFVDGVSSINGQIEDPEKIGIAKGLSDRLRSFADRIDAAINIPQDKAAQP